MHTENNMSLPRIWMSCHFPGTFMHINALANTQCYQIYASHHAARTPYLQEEAFLTHRDVIRFQEPVFEADEEYVNWCLSYCNEHQIALFIPGRARELFAARRKAFNAIGTEVMVAASARTLKILNNKIEFLEAIKALDVPIAPWRSFTTRESFNRAWRALGSGTTVDLCVKPAIGVYGSGFWRITRQKSYLHNFGRLMIDVSAFRQRLGIKVRKPWLLMTYCEGFERSIDCIAYKGKLVAALIRRKEKHGQVIEENDIISGYVKKLVAHFKLSGMINIQFKDHEGKPCVLEINPRASGGSIMAYQAGFNILPLAVEAWLNRGKITSHVIKMGLSIARTHYYYSLPLTQEAERAADDVSD